LAGRSRVGRRCRGWRICRRRPDVRGRALALGSRQCLVRSDHLASVSLRALGAVSREARLAVDRRRTSSIRKRAHPPSRFARTHLARLDGDRGLPPSPSSARLRRAPTKACYHQYSLSRDWRLGLVTRIQFIHCSSIQRLPARFVGPPTKTPGANTVWVPQLYTSRFRPIAGLIPQRLD
jgi:hypothetical protein